MFENPFLVLFAQVHFEYIAFLVEIVDHQLVGILSLALALKIEVLSRELNLCFTALSLSMYQRHEFETWPVVQK